MSDTINPSKKSGIPITEMMLTNVLFIILKVRNISEIQRNSKNLLILLI